MSYAEAQKLHDFRQLQASSGAPGQVEALRTVLAIALDRETAAWCLGRAEQSAIARWPSTLFQLLARSAVESSAVWRRCALLLDRALHEPLAQYSGRTPAELVEVFAEGRESLTGEELAALLWSLLRHRCASRDLIAERLTLELEVVAARRLQSNTDSRARERDRMLQASKCGLRRGSYRS